MGLMMFSVTNHNDIFDKIAQRSSAV